ncbi:hypothetical protein GCM10009721_33180 [Terrabacter tumescens]|uniref:Uncharacterized protein n=1 Tax=Terrabacter tumescens TaxID=60443 RepID=A0ABQ2I7Z9_9MICO|nr:hypothetical protein [Terrabacter tumescens]GGN03243.1 hypothetical protein GCM10009721_33180 [Terrabacter tumescens]
MSRAPEAGHSAAAIAGELALPLPSGDVASLRAAARSLDRTAARARATTTVRGTLGPRLGAVWTGEAAAAARLEADELGARARRVVEALPGASRSLLTYAAALEHAVARVRSLQRQWDALDAEHALAVLRLAALPDPTGAVGVLGAERARSDQLMGRARLSRSYAGVVQELRATARRCAGLVAAVTDTTAPAGTATSAAAVRTVVTGGLWFADGAVAARASRDAAIADGLLARRLMAAAAPVGGGLASAGDIDALTARLRSRGEDPVYAQALMSELGGDGLSRLLMAAGMAQSASGTKVDRVRALLGALGSLVVRATSHAAPTGTDPRTRAQLASGAALMADELVAGLDTVHTDPSGGRASGAWLLGQLLAGARATGDDRLLPARLARRAAAAAATSEIAETRDADTALSHGSTLLPDAGQSFSSWFDDAAQTGDALHVLLGHVGDDPSAAAALLAEPLPDSAVAGRALANSRGDRLTVGEHLVRRWITHEANGIETHSDLGLASDADLRSLLTSASSAAADGTDGEATGMAETRARIMLEVSRTSRFAMLDASTTRIYSRATAPLETLVVEWLSAMRDNVDLALTTPALGAPAARYAAPTSTGAQPWLDTHELTGIVGALAVDTGMGLHARDTGAAYDRLVEHELDETRRAVEAGSDVGHDVVRLGFFDQSASAALVDVARRQDVLNRRAWQGLAEAAHVIAMIFRGGVTGLFSTAQTYAEGGTLRTALDDLVISMVRSNVELAQTERNDTRRSELANRIAAITGTRDTVLPAMAVGAARGPALPTAEAVRTARAAEIRAAAEAALQEAESGSGSTAVDRLKDRLGPTDRVPVIASRGTIPELEKLPRGRSRGVLMVPDEQSLRHLFDRLTVGATRRMRPGYAGEWFERPDGIQVGLRASSRSGGATIDVRYADDQIRKVHIQ